MGELFNRYMKYLNKHNFKKKQKMKPKKSNKMRS